MHTMDGFYLTGESFPKAATIGNAISGFAKCGIWPPNRHVFTDEEFAPAQVTDLYPVPDEDEEPKLAPVAALAVNDRPDDINA